MYPPIAVLNRIAKHDYKVPGTNHVIEKDTTVVIPNFAIQRDPQYYPNPDKFDPNRFDGDEVQTRNPLAWLPFGTGPRNRIGLRFGMMQARIGLVTLLKHFEISLSTTTKPHPIEFSGNSFILSPKDEVFLKIAKLNE